MDRQVYDRMRDLERDHWWFSARREILAGEIARLPLRSGAQILEVGCGTGGNLPMLGRFGDVQAIEPDAASRLYASEQTGVEVHCGSLPHVLPSFPAGFALVAALDVIEHVEDDAGAVVALGRLLKPGGFLITTAPANPWLWSAHDVAHHHHRRYDQAAYTRLFEAAGLSVRRVSHFNSLLFPAIVAARAVGKLARRRGGDEAAQPPTPLNDLLRQIFASESAFLRGVDLPFGVSLLLIAEAPR
jgi:SAM-dependent methyltransferase